MAVPVVNKKLLEELEAMGFPLVQATQALHCSGNASLEAAVNWIIDHENGSSEIDQVSSETMDIDIDIQSPKPFDITEEMRMKSQELRNQARRRREEAEKKMERGREKERIRAGKELLEAKRIAEENERKRNISSRKAEKEEQKQAREKILQKLEADKAERRRMLGLPMEGPATVKSYKRSVHEKELQSSGPLKSTSKAERMRECLRSLKRNHKDDDARVRRAFQTLLIYVGNVARNPDEEKFRRIRLSNPLFQDRVGSLKGGVEFLELCGFERTEGNQEFLFLPREKVDIAVLYTAGSELKSAISNPFFGVF